MGYYDIDDILADAAKFPCRFNYAVPGLGYLEGNVGEEIKKNAKVELPLWLARILAIVGGDEEADPDSEGALPFVELLAPEILSSRVMNAIKSSPVALDVHSINAHFYALAVKWATLFDDRELVRVLNYMLLERTREIHNHAASGTLGGAPSTFMLTLDEFEKKLYRDTHSGCKETRHWIVRK
ncbi:DNA replication protein PSF3 [Lachancea thermotolerans CBS 6340]|uniref:DNA replication complex GINS protein PSF3 n=1 Tax=Lachancea thermotolerans (strain ATCC 56472 / CBS 6340 / NRRL Y-8284) TaxID=559295 RepID=C5DJX0_LACTC|nr:KLTH0F19756p [Lachancea thermotolerans CBS 6340]CAR24609.1 KLTH0F19756p [Lachancea thermotolerans CBS 6340]